MSAAYPGGETFVGSGRVEYAFAGQVSAIRAGTPRLGVRSLQDRCSPRVTRGKAPGGAIRARAYIDGAVAPVGL